MLSMFVVALLRSTVWASVGPPFEPDRFPTIPGAIAGLGLALGAVSIAITLYGWIPIDRLAMLLVLTAVLVASSSEPLSAATGLLPAFALIACVPLVERYRLDITERLRRLLAVVVGVCLVAWKAFPWGELSDRAQGILNNPNSLGAASFFLVFLSTRTGHRFGVLLGLFAAVASGSRAFLGACIVVIVAGVIESPERDRRRTNRRYLGIFLLAAFGFAAATLQLSYQRFGAATRVTNWRESIDRIRDGSLLGEGYSTVTDLEASNSLLLIALEAGIIGAIIGVATYGALLVLSAQYIRRGEYVLAAFVLAAIATSVVEAWMFATGSFIFVGFWMLAIQYRGAARSRPTVPATRTPASPTTPAPTVPDRRAALG